MTDEARGAPLAGWKRVAAETDLKEGVPIVVEGEGDDKALLVRVKGTIHAVSHTCPHYEEKLEKGVLFGTEIVCKSHLARMDVTTGGVVAGPAYNDLPVYPVRVEKGEVWLGKPANPKFPKPPENLGSDPRLFLIVGAGAAGNSAAEWLRRWGFAGRIVMVTPEADRPYDRPNLSKDLITGKIDDGWLPLHGSKFYPTQGIELMTGRRVVAVDPGRKSARLDDGQTLSFDKALLATGGAPRKLPVPGADGEACFTLRTPGDARAIIAAAAQWKSVVLIGAGFIGLELAGSLREKGIVVTAVAPEAVPLAHVLGDRIGSWFRSQLEAKGVTFLLGRTVKEISGAPGSKTVTLSDGSRCEAGFVVTGLGIQPVVDYLAGTPLVEGGAVPVDAGMHTRSPDIFAAGDIAAVPDAEWSRRRVEHWIVAQRQGMRAAASMLERAAGRDEVDVFWSRLAGASLKYVGHAKSWDQVVYRGVVEEGSFLAGFYLRGTLKAAATVGLAQDIVAVERLLRFGKPPRAADLENPSYDLIAAARAV
jgi:NADPH-dependent 2,4-dienoyl-CoA reductase/sulfur reductase-like enzyme/nitrite reductase/ring-hydroxylating ferredoxin subunit